MRCSHLDLSGLLIVPIKRDLLVRWEVLATDGSSRAIGCGITLIVAIRAGPADAWGKNIEKGGRFLSTVAIYCRDIILRARSQAERSDKIGLEAAIGRSRHGNAGRFFLLFNEDGQRFPRTKPSA